MVRISGVRIHSDGTVESADVLCDRSSLRWNNRLLYAHYQTKDLTLWSDMDVTEFSTAAVEPFSFDLPPPLNTYIYPKLVIVLAGSICAPSSLAAQAFADHCAKLTAQVQKVSESTAIYDVPINAPLECDGDDSEQEYEEEEIFEEESEDEGHDVDPEDDEVDIDYDEIVQ